MLSAKQGNYWYHFYNVQWIPDILSAQGIIVSLQYVTFMCCGTRPFNQNNQWHHSNMSTTANRLPPLYLYSPVIPCYCTLVFVFTCNTMLLYTCYSTFLYSDNYMCPNMESWSLKCITLFSGMSICWSKKPIEEQGM